MATTEAALTKEQRLSLFEIQEQSAIPVEVVNPQLTDEKSEEYFIDRLVEILLLQTENENK